MVFSALPSVSLCHFVFVSVAMNINYSFTFWELAPDLVNVDSQQALCELIACAVDRRGKSFLMNIAALADHAVDAALCCSQAVIIYAALSLKASQAFSEIVYQGVSGFQCFGVVFCHGRNVNVSAFAPD